LVLLLALTAALASYMYWSVHRSSLVYVHDLKRDIRATTRSLAPALENDMLPKEWNEVNDVLRRMSEDFSSRGLSRAHPPGYPHSPPVNGAETNH
jgi:hypothetical protein